MNNFLPAFFLVTSIEMNLSRRSSRLSESSEKVHSRADSPHSTVLTPLVESPHLCAGVHPPSASKDSCRAVVLEVAAVLQQIKGDLRTLSSAIYSSDIASTFEVFEF